MKKLNKFLATVLALAMIMATFALPVGAVYQNSQQLKDIAHQNAQNSRIYFGLSDDAFAVRSQSILWHYADGNNTATMAWYYDPLKNAYFDFWGNTYVPNQNFTTNNNSYRGTTLNQDGYTWTWDASVNRYYRWQNGNKLWLTNGQNSTNDYTSNGVSFKWNSYQWYQVPNGTFYRWKDGKVVWATSSEVEKIFKNGTYLGNTYYDTYAETKADSGTNSGGRTANGNSVYNYNQFSGYNWYNGVITPPNDQYIESEAKELVSLTYEYVKNMNSITLQAKIMQVAVNIANGGSVTLARDGFAKRNANAPYTDANNRSLLALARDVIWRNIAVKNGYTSAGIVASTDATHFSITGDSVILKDSNGNVLSNNLRSPYAS